MLCDNYEDFKLKYVYKQVIAVTMYYIFRFLLQKSLLESVYLLSVTQFKTLIICNSDIIISVRPCRSIYI